jgi:hypothetical protein
VSYPALATMRFLMDDRNYWIYFFVMERQK